MKIALDASALLTFLFAETGHEMVADVIDGSGISTVNLRHGIPDITADQVWARLDLPIKIQVIRPGARS